MGKIEFCEICVPEAAIVDASVAFSQQVGAAVALAAGNEDQFRVGLEASRLFSDPTNGEFSPTSFRRSKLPSGEELLDKRLQEARASLEAKGRSPEKIEAVLKQIRSTYTSSAENSDGHNAHTGRHRRGNVHVYLVKG